VVVDELGREGGREGGREIWVRIKPQNFPLSPGQGTSDVVVDELGREGGREGGTEI